MAAKDEWNIPNYELEKIAHYFLELITEQNENESNNENPNNKTFKAGVKTVFSLSKVPQWYS